MTKRYLWTIVGAALWVGAMPISLAEVPVDWVCVDGKKGACDRTIVVRESRPKSDDEVRHLVQNAKFRINYDSKNDIYSLQLLSNHWLLGFKNVTFSWMEQLDDDGQLVLMSEAVCKDLSDNSSKLVKTGKFKSADYSHFLAKAIPIHFKDDIGQVPEGHDWLIYPIGDTATNKNRDYCLRFPPKEADGGSHDGAVHGDS